MAIPFHSKFIALVAAISIGITAIAAAPAQAGSRDTERALAALLGLAVIGAVIADAQKDERKAKKKKKKVKAHSSTRNYPTIEARPLPKDLRRNAKHRALPERCLRSIETSRGKARYFGARCMNKSFKHVNRLPRSCERRINTNRGVRFGWGAKCLRREGYTLARY